MIAAQTSAGTALDVHFARYLTPSSKRRDKPRLINEYRIASEALASPARQGPGPNFGGGGNNDSKQVIMRKMKEFGTTLKKAT